MNTQKHRIALTQAATLAAGLSLSAVAAEHTAAVKAAQWRGVKH